MASTFPETDMELTFGAAFGADLNADPNTWQFTDLTSRIIDTPVTIQPGVLVGAANAKTGSVTGLTLLNDDGWLTPFLAASPYYPYVDAGTPARLTLRTDTNLWIEDLFGRTVAAGSWGTATSGQAWTGDGWQSVSAGKGLYSIPSANSTSTATIVYAHRDVDVRWDMSIAAVSTGASNVVGPCLRRNTAGTDFIWAGLEFDLAGAVKWTIRTSEASVYTIRQQIVEPGLAYGAGTSLSARVELVGDRLRAKAWLTSGSEPQPWTVDVTLTVLLDAGDKISMAAWVVNGNTNTLPNVISVDNLSVQQPQYARFEGYLADVQPTFRVLADGAEHSVVQIKLGGVGSRLEKLAAPVLTPLARSLKQSATPPVELWMCEDAEGAQSATSAFDGHLPMVVTGPAVFGFSTGAPPDDKFIPKYGTPNLCSVAAGAKLTGLVNTTGTWTQWTVSMLVDQYTPGVGGGVTEVRQLEWTTPGGTPNRWALVRTMTGHTVRAYDDTAGTSTDVCSFAHSFISLYMVEASAAQSGGNITVTLYIAAFALASASIAGTVAAPYQVRVNPDMRNTTASTDPNGIRFVAGAVMIHDTAGTFLPYYNETVLGSQPRADRGWGYEASHRRAMRLADEENIPLRIVGDPYTSGPTELNVQQPGAFQQLMTQAVDSASGSICAEEGFGYLLTERTQRYNAPVALTVDMAGYRYSAGQDPDQTLVPKLDARGPNAWTVQRADGSSATCAAPAAYRQRRGTIAQSAILDVLYDADCGPHAGWRTHLNVDGQGANYPATPLDLAANPDLIDDWLLCRIGSRMQRTNQPTIAGLGVIDQIIDGWSETVSRRAWTATLDTSPAEVWQVGVWDVGSWDSGSTTLQTAVDSDDTMLTLATGDVGDTWWRDGTGYQVVCSGQTSTVRWMSAPGSVTTLEGGFETGIAGWTAGGGSVVQSSAQARIGTYSALLTVSGSPGTASISPTTAMPVDPNVSFTATAWVYATSTVNNVRISISWYTGAGTFISSSLGSTISLGAGVWTQISVQATSPGTAGLARHVPQIFGSPANGTTMWIDDADLVLDSGTLTGPGPYVQRAWVTRGTDVVKALPAGAEVHVADPVMLAL